MKKSVLLLFALTVVQSSFAASEAEISTTSIEAPVSRSVMSPTLFLSAGPSFSETSITTGSSDFDSSLFGTRTGIQLSAELSVPLSSRMSFAPEVAYIQKGASVGLSSIDGSIQLDYISVPLKVKAFLSDDAQMRPYFVGGPYVAYAVRRKMELRDLTAKAQSTVYKEDLKDGISGFDLGFRLGVGLEMPRGEDGSLAFSLNYDGGLRNVAKGAGKDESMKNQSILLTAAIGFSI